MIHIDREELEIIKIGAHGFPEYVYTFKSLSDLENYINSKDEKLIKEKRIYE